MATRSQQITARAQKLRFVRAILLFFPFAFMPPNLTEAQNIAAENFSAFKTVEQGIEVVHLKDAGRAMEVSVVPSIGNRAVEFKIHEKNIVFFPYPGMDAFAKHPGLNGIPFLAPWANRLDEAGFWSDGTRFALNPSLHNYQTDQHGLPIHGLLTTSPLWQVETMSADANSAQVTSRLEFWKYPALMAQWPIAHEYEMTYRLAEGALEVKVTISNLSASAMPVAIGFHPYYRIPDKPRDEWVATLPVRQSVLTDANLIPTGEFKPLDLPNPLPLKDHILDNGFTDMERDAEGRAHFLLQSGGESIELMFGPKYPVSVIWEPRSYDGKPAEFICFEPMTGVTNAINLHHAGKYQGLQTVAAGSKWTESFWVKPTGF